MVTDPDLKMTDRETGLSYNIGFQDRSSLSFDVKEEFVVLDRPYDPTNTDGLKLGAGESFNWVSGSVGFKSDTRRVFNYSVNAGYGDYYNGTRWNVSGSVSYRIQYYGSLEISANYNNISLPEPYSNAKLLLISPRLDITFTDRLFLTTFVQYNNQVDNLNVNIRFQWRFAPVSDLFIVFTGYSYTHVANPAIDDFSN
jgi:hypothetical protein